MSDYEALRRSNMAANKVMLDQLGLTEEKKAREERKKRKKNKRKAPPAQAASRKSARSAGKPAPTYTPADPVTEQEDKGMSIAQEKAAGVRGSDGKYCGERFGGTKGIKVGTVFGAGDYQRLGRTEMVANGAPSTSRTTAD